MKNSDETCLLPGNTGVTGWRDNGKGGLAVMEPGKLRRADWIALPQRQVITLPVRFPAMNDDRRDAAAQLELEGLGLTNLEEDDFQVITHDTSEHEQRGIIAVQAAGHSVPPEATLDSKFAPSSEFRTLRPGTMSMWKENGQWCMAVPDDKGHAIHAQALTAQELDEDAAAELRCVLGALDLIGVTPEVHQLSLEHPATEPPPLDHSTITSNLELPVTAEIEPPPHLPQTNWRLAPPVILEKRRERSQRQTAFLVGMGGLLVIIALLGAFTARLWSRDRAITQEVARLDVLEPELANIREAQSRWSAIGSALTPDKTPAEVFHQVSRLLPAQGIRISAFKLNGPEIIISGEAQDQGLEGQFRQNLIDSQSPAFAGLQWDTPNSRQQADGRLTFDWQASPPTTEENNGG